jgi:ParB family chromosome partitioning protein
MQDELKHLPPSAIVVNPYQPRREFKPEELEELAQSIRTIGLLHPPLVRPLSDTLYELISGERRLRAAQLASLELIPVYVRWTSGAHSAEAALIENVQRVDLNPLEIAQALKRLMTEFKLSQELLAQRIGKKRSTIANYLRLLTLPQAIQESVSRGCITMGHAKAILSVEEEKKRLLLHELILRDGLTVREAEQAAQRMGEKVKKQHFNQISRDCYLDQLIDKVRERLGTQVSIQTKGKQGRLIIDYYNYDDLDRLLALLGIHEMGEE